jgi:hypothetical protein
MPELPVKEVRLSELHLPEINRDEIVRSLSEIRLPAVELPRVERPRFDVPGRIGRIDWRSIDLTGALAGAATIARIGRPVLRRRWTLAVGAVIVAGLAAAALLANPAVRERAGRTVRDLRARMDARSDADATLEIEADAASMADAGQPAPTEAATDVEGMAVDVAGGDTEPADVEEAGSPA